MDMAVIRAIHNPEGWRKALGRRALVLGGCNLRSFVEADDGTRAVCLWEAPDPARVEGQSSSRSSFGNAVATTSSLSRVNYFEGRSNERSVRFPSD